MCQPKPGRRCASDTRTAFASLTDLAAQQQAAGDTKGLAATADKLERNRLDYYGTRTGRSEADDEAARLPDTARRKALSAQLTAAAELATLRDMATDVVSHVPDDHPERKRFIAAVDTELYAQAQYRLHSLAKTPRIGARLRQRVADADAERRAMVREYGLPDYPPGQLPVMRCTGCGEFADDTHSCPGPNVSTRIDASNSFTNIAEGHLARTGHWDDSTARQLVDQLPDDTFRHFDRDACAATMDRWVADLAEEARQYATERGEAI